MKTLLKAGDLTQDEFLHAVGQWEAPAGANGVTRIWAEGADGWTLDYWQSASDRLLWFGAAREPLSVSGTDALGRSWAGRIFAPWGELRWRLIPSGGERCRRVVFLGIADLFAGLLTDRSEILAGLTPRTERFLLWGQQTSELPGEWIELRVPHRFRYPVREAAREVLAVVEIWTDGLAEPHFVRLCDLEPYQEVG